MVLISNKNTLDLSILLTLIFVTACQLTNNDVCDSDLNFWYLRNIKFNFCLFLNLEIEFN